MRGRNKRNGDGELAWLELHQVSGLLQGELSRRLERDAGMSAAEHDVLWYLANTPDRRLTMSDLADRLLISRSGTTRLVDRMERRGWVERETLPANRRSTYAVLTPEGTMAVRRSVRVVWSARPELFDDRLTETDLADLRRVLGKLQRRLQVVD
ncbi:MAG TPA: MarR family transcriptional regulator [Kribbellaceae bacterium]|nr:MarR family transcriptional regulator [Kribbellaceae bacterium]